MSLKLREYGEMGRRFRSVMLAGTMLAVAAPAFAASTETVIYSNNSGVMAGGLVAGKNGVLYGMVGLATKFMNSAYAYSLTPPKPGQSTWTFRRIYSFPLKMSYYTEGSLIMDPSGALYGTLTGGANTGGIVFRLTPPGAGKKGWTETDLYDFPNSDGPTSPPHGPLLRTANGDLYGSTHYNSPGGGCTGSTCGEVFKLSPPAPGGSVWSFNVLYTFLGQADGGQPNAGLIKDASGAIYGTAQYAGLSGCYEAQGCGTVFKLTPPTKGEKAWTETTLYSFTGGADGGNPNGDLLLDSSGTLVGTTMNGGAVCDFYGCGVVFSLSPPTVGQNNWTESVLWTFQNQTTATFPVAGLTPAGNGSYFGVTANAAFKLIPAKDNQDNWDMMLLHNFDSQCTGADVYDPTGKLVRGVNSSFFGAATQAGSSCHGGVFEITP
jgi:uncharacterized protein YceK